MARRTWRSRCCITTLEALRAQRLREPEKLASFVLGTCRMTVLDQRRGPREGNVSLSSLEPNCWNRRDGPVPRLDHDRLKSCMENLRERERTLIVMTFYDEETARRRCRLYGTFRSQRARDSPSGDSPVTQVHGRCVMRIGNGGDCVNCSNPLDPAVLADYWLACSQGPKRKPSRSICSAATDAGTAPGNHRSCRRRPQPGACGLSANDRQRCIS